MSDGLEPLGYGQNPYTSGDEDPFGDGPTETANPVTSQNEPSDEEDGDPDEDDDEDEEDEDSGRKSRKRPKHRHKRDAAARFLDIEAEVSDEDDDIDEDDDEEAAGFIDTVEPDDDVQSRRHHAMLDAQRHFDDEDRSPEQIARDLRQRHGGRTAVRYTGDMNEIPQRLLMPSVHDPSLWQIRVKPGRERDIIFSLMRKSMDVEFTARPLKILTAFQRDSLPGMIYIEARSSQQVSQACNGLVGVYLSRGINLVPIEEMASLLQIRKQDSTVKPGSWVRLKRGIYAGDLAQVVDVTELGDDFGLKIVPRIDLTPKDNDSLEGASRKRKKLTARPHQRLFNLEEVRKVHGAGAVIRRNDVYVFSQETYRDGFLEKDFKLSNLITEDVNPTLEEISLFRRRDQGGQIDSSVDLSIIAEASRKAAIAVLQPGDQVEVFEGEQAGVHGTVLEINGEVVTIAASDLNEGTKVDLPARSVRKRFKPGDHVKVMAGRNADETGLVVSVAENIVTFVSDMTMQEVSVFSKDLREAAEVGSSTNTVGNYELHDLVQLDLQTVGVIFKTERDSFRVIDQHGQIKTVQPHQISMRRDSNRSIATDSQGHELRPQDNMKEVDGEGRKGRVLHVYQTFFAFLHNRDIAENGGVFVTRARSLVSIAPKTMKVASDLSKMDPNIVAPSGGMVGSGNMGRGPRDRHIGTNVMVVKGTYKGYIGIIKDTNGNIARVELNTGNKVISIDKDKLKERLNDGGLRSLVAPGGPRGASTGGPFGGPSKSSNPYLNSSAASSSPSWGNALRTPNPYNAEGRTPAWNASSRTPNPYAANQTPAWNASSRTPNPYASDTGRTPAWNANSRTPNPYSGGQTPGRPTGGWGGATPARTTAPAATSSWGGATPARTNATASWGSEQPSFDSANWGGTADTPAAAPTPALAPTPAAYWGAPTPAPYMTPGFAGSAPTPSGAAGYGTGREPFDLPEAWFLDSLFSNSLNKIKIYISGSNADRYLDGAYEGKSGHILGAQQVGQNFDQTAMIKFDDGEVRSILGRYIVPVEPLTKDSEALVLTGKFKGQVVKVWDVQDHQITFSTHDMTSWEEAGKNELALIG